MPQDAANSLRARISWCLTNCIPHRFQILMVPGPLGTLSHCMPSIHACCLTNKTCTAMTDDVSWLEHEIFFACQPIHVVTKLPCTIPNKNSHFECRRGGTSSPFGHVWPKRGVRLNLDRAFSRDRQGLLVLGTPLRTDESTLPPSWFGKGDERAAARFACRGPLQRTRDGTARGRG